ncbi:hypothetical protein [Cupriavidus sp. TMH.W2]|uniref:hypothetical protein n=1 Tax=Cupriavidus sp. TMH.W2 TaxID=3434465 RepID=UPI003D7886D7
MTGSQQGAGLSAEQLDDLYNPDGDGEHPLITRAMWRQAVAQQDTVSGYWPWLAQMLSDDAASTVKPALTITEGAAPLF